ncbi:MAG: isoprenylcysteine carboxylmethyltransferase family protein, partial [Pseudomonadota bacterium]
MHHLELKIPPAVLVLLFAWAMWYVAEVSPWAVVQIPGKVLVASVLWGAGVVLIIIGAVAFISAKTTVNPLILELTTSIVTRGIYK